MKLAITISGSPPDPTITAAAVQFVLLAIHATGVLAVVTIGPAAVLYHARRCAASLRGALSRARRA